MLTPLKIHLLFLFSKVIQITYRKLSFYIPSVNHIPWQPSHHRGPRGEKSALQAQAMPRIHRTCSVWSLLLPAAKGLVAPFPESSHSLSLSAASGGPAQALRIRPPLCCEPIPHSFHASTPTSPVYRCSLKFSSGLERSYQTAPCDQKPPQERKGRAPRPPHSP